jgi:hypothetical protein
MKPVLGQPRTALKHVRAVCILNGTPSKGTGQGGHQKLFMLRILEKRSKKFGRKQGMNTWQNGRRNARLQQKRVKTGQTKHASGDA